MFPPLIEERRPLLATTPQIFNIELTEANTEYEFNIPDRATCIMFKARNAAHPLQFSWEAGASGTVYMSLNNMGYAQENITAHEIKIYFQSSSPGCVVEFLVWF